MAQIKARKPGGEQENVELDRKPDACPICHHAVDPLQQDVAIATGPLHSKGTEVECVFQCTRRACERLFLGRYVRTRSQGEKQIGPFKLRELAPRKFQKPKIAEEIEKISSAFKEIFSQAAAAEDQNLGEIAGLAYRKSLEFLVKDYCIQKDPSKEDEIKKETLGTTIANRIDDPNVKECAKRAAWLGNDEAHYVRRWEDRDIQDLKILIELTTNWIRNCVLTEKYLKDMNK